MLFFIHSTEPDIESGCLIKSSLVDELHIESSSSISVDGLSASWSNDHKLVLSNIICTVNKVSKQTQNEYKQS